MTDGRLQSKEETVWGCPLGANEIRGNSNFHTTHRISENM